MYTLSSYISYPPLPILPHIRIIFRILQYGIYGTQRKSVNVYNTVDQNTRWFASFFLFFLFYGVTLLSENSKTPRKIHNSDFLVERKVETCLKHHCAYPNVTARATHGSRESRVCNRTDSAPSCIIDHKRDGRT